MTVPLFIGGIGGPELVLVFLLVILLFGADKLPKLARSSGEAMGEFQKGREEVERELQEAKARATEPVATDEVATDEADDVEADDVEAVDEDGPDAGASPA
ncbi:twin-arginine translocase TatA/TatE family subunit [Haloarchaeobius sp. HRN-SO-5]|uniref:twin-arginine translocase TatA/TatE family subunit n=1 Tax=Haloarchaeobius sp. HRN-SO-5 TaxID=3446118 RepID=UPI003EBA4549